MTMNEAGVVAVAAAGCAVSAAGASFFEQAASAAMTSSGPTK
jgi:hypothetical protein